MRKLLVTKWVTALRSKKYKQGDSALRIHTPKGDEFCCLGVLGDLTPRTKGFTWIAPAGSRDGDREFEYSLSDPSNPNMRTTGTLTMDQLARIGMHDEWQTVLINLNDGGYTFTTIAKLVEKYGSVLHRQVPSELRDECDNYPLDSAALLRAAKIRALPVESRREKPLPTVFC